MKNLLLIGILLSTIACNGSGPNNSPLVTVDNGVVYEIVEVKHFASEIFSEECSEIDGERDEEALTEIKCVETGNSKDATILAEIMAYTVLGGDKELHLNDESEEDKITYQLDEMNAGVGSHSPQVIFHDGGTVSVDTESNPLLFGNDNFYNNLTWEILDGEVLIYDGSGKIINNY